MILDCYILDDERHAVELLQTYVEQTAGLRLAGSSTKPLEALTAIPALRPAITFADVDMPELSGLDLAGRVAGITAIVFTTAYREFAPEAFEKDAVDYLLKPISYARFLSCIDRVKRKITVDSAAHFMVKTGARGALARIAVDDITYIAGLSAYIEIHLAVNKIVTYLSLAELLEQLPPDRFSRIHKSFIVAHDRIKLIADGQVKLVNGDSLPIGRVYRRAFYDKLERSLLVSRRELS
jgi:two-component system LytT family response regulator